MTNLKPNQQRAKNAITLIWIVLALEIVSLISGYFQYDLLNSAANGKFILPEVASANDTRESIISIIYIITFIISGVTFILWFRRAYFNLHLKVDNLAYSEGWAAGSWFVPIMNLFRPFQIMKELYEETKKLLTKNGFVLNESFSINLLTWWWTLWIISQLIAQITIRYPSDSINRLITSTILGMIENIIGIFLAVITVKVIKEYAAVEPLLNEIIEDQEIIPDNTYYEEETTII